MSNSKSSNEDSEATRERTQPSSSGVAAIRHALKTIPLSPGVYRMIDARGNVLYVGKALSLKKRVVSYTRPQQLPERLQKMIAATVSVEIVTTHTEADALLLEANFIKRMKPRYNILLRDDKTYPWIMLKERHLFPQITKQRGKPEKGITYWGPFASARSVNQTLNLIQKSFLIRSCSDSVFASRSRPCLLFQIKRCSAPCVERISPVEYGKLLSEAKQFLSGKSDTLLTSLTQQMEQAAESLDFERAAHIRDRLRGFASLQDSGVINPASLNDADVVAVWQEAGITCVQVFFIRAGRNNGNRAFFPAHTEGENPSEVLAAFLLQFYDDKPPPATILVNADLHDPKLVTQALSIRGERKVEVLRPLRGEKHAVIAHAVQNARDALERRLAETAGMERLLQGVAHVFGLADMPSRIETYDNSHISGRNAYGVMVVADREGFARREYRKFGIRNSEHAGDDFAMMREVIERRFNRLNRQNPDENDWKKPDFILIDGGVGQLNATHAVLKELNLEDIPLAAMAKGVDRNSGREWFHTLDKPPFQLPPNDPVLYYLQRLRDEAHRFAISTHRDGRSNSLRRSELDQLEGIGPARKRALLHRFGSARGVKAASIDEIASVRGINRNLANSIYQYFHPK